MGGKTDVVKGRIKEAAGVLTGNDNLREEGRVDHAGYVARTATRPNCSAVPPRRAGVGVADASQKAPPLPREGAREW